MGGWGRALPNEARGAGREHVEPALVAVYDRKSAFDPAADVALLRELGLESTSTLIDLGAGTGTFAVAAGPHCGRVVAVDVSAAMVARARESVRAQGVTNVECVQAGLLTYDHRGAPADFAYCRNVLHHLPDFWKTIALVRTCSLLRPGGMLRLRDIVFSFDPADAESALAAWLDAAPERPEEGWTRSEREAHLREEHSTFTWLLEPMLERAGFDVTRAGYSPGGIFADYVCVKARSPAT